MDPGQQLPYPGPPSSVSILDPAGNVVLCIAILPDGRLDVTGDETRWTDAARLFLDGLRNLGPPPASLDDVDRYTLDRARALASAATDSQLRTWFRMTPGEAVPMAANFTGEPLARAALVSAQDLLGCLATLADPGPLDRIAAKVDAMHTALTDALSALVDDVPVMPALDQLGEVLDSLSAMLPRPAGIDQPGDFDGPTL